MVSLTAPAAGSTQRGTVTVSASASDAVGVAGVQFRLDGADLGAEDTSAPYSASWNTTTATAGAHTLSAIARDAAGNRTTAANVTVTVDNSAPAGPSPLAAYAFENGSGTTVTDTTGNGNTGTIREATWTTTGRNGRALRFDGVNDWVTVNDTPALRLSSNLTLEAWVNPTTTTGWRTAILKETTSDLAYALYSSGSARPSAHLTTTTGAGSATAPTAAPINTWTHLAATYDAITIRLYLNGTQVATARPHQPPHHQHQPTAPRRQQHLGRMVRRPTRRHPHLRQHPHPHPNPNRHDHPRRLTTQPAAAGRRLLDGDGLGEVARLVHVEAAQARDRGRPAAAAG